MKTKYIARYYDRFAKRQKKTGVNLRIYSLFKRLKKYGLNRNSNVLELGCGIGVMTYLISRVVKTGKILAVDFSPASIKCAKENVTKSNVSFQVADVVDFGSKRLKANFITLFDVIEHIPIEKHEQLFWNVSYSMNKDTLLLINIPNPDYIVYNQRHNPKALQIIDQPVYMTVLLANLDNAGLEVVFCEKYKVWIEDDYVFYLVRKKRDFEVSEPKLIELVKRILMSIMFRLMYNY